MNEVELFVASRNCGWRDAQRALSSAVSIRNEAREEETRVYYDTFDGRLYRAGFELIAVGDDVVLRDAATTETVAKGRWNTARDPRFAGDLGPQQLRDAVSGVTDPRVLREVIRARVASHDALARDENGRLVARLRSEAAHGRRGGRPWNSRVVFVNALSGTEESKAVEGVRRALRGAGYRASATPWTDRLLAACGHHATEYAPLPRPPLDPSATLRTAALAIFPRLLTVMIRNEAGVREGVDSEFLHDFRVALRRTRTGLAALGSALPAEDARRLRSRFAELAGPTGRVRDLEVQLARRFEYAAWIPHAFAGGLEPVVTSLEAQRRTAHAALTAILESHEHATLKRDWKQALARLAAGRPAGVGADELALPVARAHLAKRYARLCEIAASIESLDDTALHRARVQGKKLRYVLEFFARPLGDDAEEAVAFVERLQSALGDFHDANVQIASLEVLARGPLDHTELANARAGAIGAVMARLEVERAKLRRRSTRRLLELGEKKQARLFERLLDG